MADDPRILELRRECTVAHASGSGPRMQAALCVLLDAIESGEVALVLARRPESRVVRDGPHPMRARYVSRCAVCGSGIEKGAAILFQQHPRRVTHAECGGGEP